MNVLFVHYGDDWIAGSEVALLEMLRQFLKDGVTPALWCNGKEMAAEAAALGVTVYRDAFRHFFDYSSPPFSAGAYLGLIRRGGQLIAETKADVVHCNSAAPVQWMRPACWRAGVPMLANMHSPYLKRSRYVLGLHLADRVVAVAAAIAEPLLADGMAADRVSVVYNGFDGAALLNGDASGLRAQIGVPDSATVGAIAGSLIHRKGHDILFEAMARLTPGERPFHLLVIGGGPNGAALRAAASGLPIHFLGHRHDLGAILRDNVDFLVAPSRQEAFGRVIIEAAFAGVPAIGARVDGIPEAILEDVTGLLVPPEAPIALAEAIDKLSHAPELRRRLGIAAQMRARQEFSIEICTRRMAAEYQAMQRRFHADGRRRIGAGQLQPYWNLLARKTAP